MFFINIKHISADIKKIKLRNKYTIIIDIYNLVKFYIMLWHDVKII